MIDGTYQFNSKTPLGKQKGTIEIATDGPVAAATINAAGKSKHLTGTLDGNKATFAAEVKLPFPFGKLKFNIDGEVVGEELLARVSTKRFKFNVTGTKVA